MKHSQVIAEKKKQLAQKKQKLHQMLKMTKLLAGEEDEDEKRTNDELLEEVNDVFTKMGEKPITVIYRTKEVAKGSREAAKGDRKLAKFTPDCGKVDIRPGLAYPKEIQTNESFLRDYKIPSAEKEGVKQKGNRGEIKPIRDRIDRIDFGDDIEEDGEDRKIFSDEEVEEVMTSPVFQSFFSKSSLLMERCLSTKYDPLMDYQRDDTSAVDSEEKLTLVNVYECSFSKDRPITAVDFNESKKYQDLFLGSFFKKSSKQGEGGGVVVYNQNMPNRPEMIFSCESPISSALFYRYDPQVIIGGTYTGEVLFWDMRIRGKKAQLTQKDSKIKPSERTPVNFKTHRLPIFGMKVVGTKQAHNLITLSSDGVLCEWPKCQLSKEPNLIRLSEKQSFGGGSGGGGSSSNQMNEIGAVCLGTRKGLHNRFFIGSENGVLYSAYLYGTRKGVDSKYEGHYGTVTGVDFHPADEFGDYCLTSSVDWSVILRSQREQKTLYTFGGYDNYVYDVKWSPIHPSLFATVDASGFLKLWDLNLDTETPIYSQEVEKARAASRLCWSMNGTHIAVGTVSGKMHLFKVDEETAKPNPDENKKFHQSIEKMNNIGDLNL